MAPVILDELKKIDKGFEKVQEIIRANSTMSRSQDDCPIFMQNYKEYHKCLQYQRNKLCGMLE